MGRPRLRWQPMSQTTAGNTWDELPPVLTAHGFLFVGGKAEE